MLFVCLFVPAFRIGRCFSRDIIMRPGKGLSSILLLWKLCIALASAANVRQSGRYLFYLKVTLKIGH